MLCQPYPGIRLPSRTRTTSESTTVVTPPSRHPQSVNWPGHHSSSTDPSGPRAGHLDIGDGGPRQRLGSKGIRDFFRLVTRPSSGDIDRKNAAGTDRKLRKATDLQQPHQSPAECHTALQGSRLNQLKESFRPRSQSEASSIPRRHHHASTGDAERGQAGIEPQTSNGTRTSIESEVKSSRRKWDKAETSIPGRPHQDKCEADVPPRASTPTPPGRSEKLRECGGTKGSKNGERLNIMDSTINNTLRVAGFPLGINGDTANHLSPHSPNGRTKFLRGRIGPEEFIEMYRDRAFSDPRPQSRLEAVANVRMRRVGPPSFTLLPFT